MSIDPKDPIGHSDPCGSAEPAPRPDQHLLRQFVENPGSLSKESRFEIFVLIHNNEEWKAQFSRVNSEFLEKALLANEGKDKET